MRTNIFLVFLVFLWSCQPSKNIPISQDLHENWSFKSKHDSTWYAATVPGTIFTDLLDHNQIEDPFLLENEGKVQWVSDSSWTYQSTFERSKAIAAKKHVELNLDGLDTYAKVYLNDSLILESSNAFLKHQLDVTRLLSRVNTLRIDFESTSLAEEKAKQKAPYSLPEGNRIYTRKPQFQYGWDWGPKLNTSGIWKNISLNAWDDVRMKDVYIKTTEIHSEQATLLAEVSITSTTETKASLGIVVAGKENHHNVLLKKGTQVYKFPITIQNPKLWWPHNLGTPYRYPISFSLDVNNTVQDQKEIQHGIRTLTLITEKDSIGTSFYFKVNGVAVYAKGANYIPQHSFQNKVTKEHYTKLLDDVVAANMNMLRVWGGGIYEHDEFYRLCDEKGILVWQDFMFACAMYPGDKAFLKSVEEEAKQQVRRLRNHPSIALWAGNNENSEGWHRWGWQEGRSTEEKTAIWNDYLAIFDSILPQTVARLSQTSYWESSPKYGRGNPNYTKEGDAHDWWVWHDGYPFEHFETNTPRFMSEFGFQSYPSEAVINYINQKDSLALHTEAVKSHQKHSRGFELIDSYMKRDYPIPTNDKDYRYVSQLVQARGIIMGIEAQRRAKPYTMGSLYWQLNDCWPAISWSSIDYFGNWKALHYKTKEAFDNLLISTVKTTYDYDTFIVNDGLTAINGTLKLTIMDFYGKEIWSTTKELRIQPNSSEKVYHIPQADIYTAGYVYVIEFDSAKSLYYFAKPKDLQLPKAAIEQEIHKTEHGYSITLKSSVLQKEVYISSLQKGHFTTNFFDLLPNIPKTIYFETSASEIPKIEIRSLNDIL